jgi:hypothetical protein
VSPGNCQRHFVRRQIPDVRERPNRPASRVDDLNIVSGSESRGTADVEVRLAPRCLLEVRARPLDDLLRAGTQRVVDLPAQLIADDEEDDEGSRHDCERNRRGGNESQARPEAEVAKAHGSRSA